MADDQEDFAELRKQIKKECKANLRLGRRTHAFYLSTITLTIGSSALASVLALGFKGVDMRLVGVLALIPGICAGISDRFHLLLKKHWYYRKYDKLNALLRRMDFVLPSNSSPAQIAEVAEEFCKIDQVMSRAWEQLENERPAKEEDAGKSSVVRAKSATTADSA